MSKNNRQSSHPIETLPYIPRFSWFQIPEKELMESHPVVKDIACSTQQSSKIESNFLYWNVPHLIFNSLSEPQLLQPNVLGRQIP